MKIQHYCYTRTNYMDYGNFVLPASLLKKEVDAVKNKVLSITGDIDPKLLIPKWLLVKKDNLIFWGCCCWNKLLAKDKFKDYSGTPVYGYFAIVLQDYRMDEVKLPYDLNYFKELYSLEIEPYWNKREERMSSTNCYIPGTFNYIYARNNEYVSLLNTDLFKCLSLGNVDKDKVIAAALTLDNVTLLIDNDNIGQATNKKGAFMNCLSSSVHVGEYSVKQQCPKCKKFVSSFTQTGVCFDCKEAEEVIIRDEDDMDKQLKIELELAQNKIAELKSEIESNRLRLKNKDRLIKILAAILVVLLVVLLYSQDSFSLKLFEEKQETQYTPERDSLDKNITLPKGTNNSSYSCQRAKGLSCK